ncbi:fatty acid--CoA ligase family protein [Actinosynnema sp. NPDC047251]|uniref:Amide synthetase n=1 Tax=Saccharothrix espanaensis (strain ATCC 51144 / DSM 44229 / JCM 9112 / NBRC 15066 / NRRL 15764) TaxID=1179773 RepID=K0K5K7_SACES|nr:fatty acid--CoA ligase family protein [Saccharothrix espanaensis]CCH32124.1 Amide synthetase [Saccharothrix espanaensis DSM 44229]
MGDNGNYVRDLLTAVAGAPDRPALHWRGRVVTGRELADRVTAAARDLAGLVADRPGGTPVVGLLTVTNTPETLVLRYAANLAGATAVHLQTANAVDPLDRIDLDWLRGQLDIVRVDVLAVDAEHLDAARALRDALASPPALAGLGLAAADVVDLAAGPAGFAEPRVTPDAPATVTYTSGSSGRPKGVAVSFGVRRAAVRGLVADPGTVYLSTLPLSHTSGAVADMTLVAGGSVVLHPEFDAGEALAAVERHRVTRMTVSPPQLYALLEHPSIRDTDLSSLRTLTYAGCPAAPTRLAEAVKVFGDVLTQTYGTTELGPITELGPADHHDPELLDSAGRPTFAEVTVRDPEGRELPPGRTGEVWVRTPFAMLGYWPDPAAADAVRDDGGRYRTGDLGRFDERGYLRLHGRMSDMIKSRGVKVHPTAVEHVLTGHPDVLGAAVFGVLDADRVEHVHAAVVPRPGTSPTSDVLRGHVGGALSPNHAPVVIRFCAELPLNPAGKPDRAALRAAAGDRR